MIDESVKIVKVKHRKTVTIVKISQMSYEVLSCSNHEQCRRLGIMKCPAYCEKIVFAKDYYFKRRKPKAEVVEIDMKEVERFPHLMDVAQSFSSDQGLRRF